MTSKNIKTIFFAVLIVAMILPFSSIQFVIAEEPNKILQIQKPTESKLERDTKLKVKNLFLEKLALEYSGKDLKDKHEKTGKDSLNTDDYLKLEQIYNRLNEISAEFVKINIESQKLYAPTLEEKNFLESQQQTVMDSDIPFHSIGTDMKIGALFIGFVSQEIADENISRLNEILSVPYYLEISVPDVDLACANLDSNCDPLMGGIEIGTQKADM